MTEPDTIKFGIYVATTFFALFSPFATMPVFMALTSELSKEAARRAAFKAIGVATVTTVIFALCGTIIFDVYGISENSLRIAGGIVIFFMGLDLMNARMRKKQEEETEDEFGGDVSITPIGIPLLCGPGAISTAMILYQDAETAAMQASFFIGFLAVALLTLTFFLLGKSISRLLGKNGVKIVVRLMGLILMIIGVEFITAGIGPIVQGILGITPIS